MGLGIALLAFGGLDLAPNKLSATSRSNASLPSSVHELLADEKKVGTCDIAVSNLLCAKGLPDAEHLDIAKCLRTLDEWAARIRSETQKYHFQFQSNPAEYRDSLGYYRMITMVTVLQKDLGVRYNPDAVGSWDFSHSSDVFINGLLSEKRTGTCSSMPGHLFVRWDDPAQGGERFNIDATTQGITCPTDEHYAKWPFQMSKVELASGVYLRNLTPQEELAEFLTMRGNCLEDIGRKADAVAMYGLAHSLVPKSPRYAAFIAKVVRLDGGTVPSLRPARFPARRPPAMRSPPMDEWVDALNEHNRRLLAGEIPREAMPPLPPGIRHDSN